MRDFTKGSIGRNIFLFSIPLILGNLFLQLYKDRYPIKVLKELYLPNMRNTIADVIFCIVYGNCLICNYFMSRP